MSPFNMFDTQSTQPQHATLEELISSMMSMDNDPLADAGTNVVISRGNPEAKLLIVGEAPGPEENIQGKPFVGRAGKMLDKILQAAEFDSDKDVYITNSVFRMPVGEGGKTFRKPSNEEIEFYRPYVAEIIRLVNPHITLLTGNVACYSVLGQTGITKLRGHWTQIDNRWIRPIFHPSYLLRNPSKERGAPKSLMWDDIREVRKKYNELMGD